VHPNAVQQTGGQHESYAKQEKQQKEAVDCRGKNLIYISPGGFVHAQCHGDRTKFGVEKGVTQGTGVGHEDA